MRLKEKVVLVTGGGVGLGKAYTLGLAREGARVVVADIQADKARKVAEEILRKGGEAIAVRVDISSKEEIRRMVEIAWRRYGRIDVLVNNAGLYTALRKKSFMEITPEEWDRVMAVNLRGMFLCSQAVYPLMKRQGKGKIINISSGTVFIGIPYFAHYVASKAGVIGLTRALARELGKDNIAVNVIAPGLTLSGPQQKHVISEELLEKHRRGRCFPRDQYPRDLLGAVIFLASNESDFITGQTLNVDGGFTMH